MRSSIHESQWWVKTEFSPKDRTDTRFCFNFHLQHTDTYTQKIAPLSDWFISHIHSIIHPFIDTSAYSTYFQYNRWRQETLNMQSKVVKGIGSVKYENLFVKNLRINSFCHFSMAVGV